MGSVFGSVEVGRGGGGSCLDASIFKEEAQSPCFEITVRIRFQKTKSLLFKGAHRLFNLVQSENYLFLPPFLRLQKAHLIASESVNYNYLLRIEDYVMGFLPQKHRGF